MPRLSKHEPSGTIGMILPTLNQTKVPTKDRTQ